MSVLRENMGKINVYYFIGLVLRTKKNLTSIKIKTEMSLFLYVYPQGDQYT